MKEQHKSVLEKLRNVVIRGVRFFKDERTKKIIFKKRGK